MFFWLSKSIDEVDIRECLYANDWNLIETMKQLRDLQRKRRMKAKEDELNRERMQRQLEKEALEREKVSTTINKFATISLFCNNGDVTTGSERKRRKGK